MRPAVAGYAKPADDKMRKHISQKQHRLEKDNTRTPHKITSAVIRQKHLRNDQFDLKEEECCNERDEVKNPDFSHRGSFVSMRCLDTCSFAFLTLSLNKILLVQEF